MHTHRRWRSVAMGIAVAGTLVLPALGQAQTGQVTFQTPSRNIVCLMTSSGVVECWLMSSACAGEDGMTFAHAWAFDRSRRPSKFCPGDLVQPARTLRYGRRLTLGGATCTSRKSGLTCRNLRRGYGFFLSRERQRIF